MSFLVRRIIDDFSDCCKNRWTIQSTTGSCRRLWSSVMNLEKLYSESAENSGLSIPSPPNLTGREMTDLKMSPITCWPLIGYPWSCPHQVRPPFRDTDGVCTICQLWFVCCNFTELTDFLIPFFNLVLNKFPLALLCSVPPLLKSSDFLKLSPPLVAREFLFARRNLVLALTPLFLGQFGQTKILRTPKIMLFQGISSFLPKSESKWRLSRANTCGALSHSDSLKNCQANALTRKPCIILSNNRT
eukprot:sb/3468911/